MILSTRDLKDQVHRRIRESVEYGHALVPGRRFPPEHRLRHINFEKWIRPGWIDEATAQVLCDAVPPEILERIQVVVGVGVVGPLIAEKIAELRSIQFVPFRHHSYFKVVEKKFCLLVDAARRTGTTLMDGEETIRLFGGQTHASVVLVDCSKNFPTLPLLKAEVYSFEQIDTPSYLREHCPICKQIMAVKQMRGKPNGDLRKVQTEYEVRYRSLFDSVKS